MLLTRVCYVHGVRQVNLVQDSAFLVHARVVRLGNIHNRVELIRDSVYRQCSIVVLLPTLFALFALLQLEIAHCDNQDVIRFSIILMARSVDTVQFCCMCVLSSSFIVRT